jgi:hypothetical protein
VFDDWFETVTAEADRTPPEWKELVNDSRFQNVLDADVDPPHLDDAWLDDTARLMKPCAAKEETVPPSLLRLPTTWPLIRRLFQLLFCLLSLPRRLPSPLKYRCIT